MPKKKITVEAIQNQNPLAKVDPNVRAIIANGMEQAVLGFGAGPQSGGQIAQTDTLLRSLRYYLISNLRQPLNECYVEIGLVQTIVDLPVDDAFRGGPIFKSKTMEAEELEDLTSFFEEEDVTASVVGQAFKWNRLFGGAGIIIITDQDPESELDIESIGPDTHLEFKAVDMWELSDGLQYASGMNPTVDPSVDFYYYYGKRLHKSRVLKLKGKEAPSFVRPRLRGWGLSEIEILVRSINQYLKSNGVVFELLDEAKIDFYQLDGFASLLMAKGGTEAAIKRMQIMNFQKNNQNAVMLDGKDKWEQKVLNYTGLAEMMREIRIQVASDMRMPLTKLFGVSATGLNPGQDDIENYNGMVESSVRSKSKHVFVKIAKLLCKKRYGVIPPHFQVEFKPLRVLSGVDEEAVKTQQQARLDSAYAKGMVSAKEYKDSCNKAGLIPVQLDTSADVQLPETGEQEKAVKNALEVMPRIVCVGVTSAGELLTGKRRDNGLWTCPGGHMDGDESPEEAACREVWEESGIFLMPSNLRKISEECITSHRTGKQFMLYAFMASVPKEKATAKNDPDKEISEWKWVKIDPKTPELQAEVRHAKKDHILAYLFEDSK